jgi:hypothetical protein
MVPMMQRRTWLAACLLALFGLQGPLCIAACIAGSSSSPEIADQSSAMPCHQESEAPADRPVSHDCECYAASDVVVATAVAPIHYFVVIRTKAFLPIVAHRQVRTRIHRGAIPPTDILLLKTILIV